MINEGEDLEVIFRCIESVENDKMNILGFSK